MGCHHKLHCGSYKEENYNHYMIITVSAYETHVWITILPQFQMSKHKFYCSQLYNILTGHWHSSFSPPIRWLPTLGSKSVLLIRVCSQSSNQVTIVECVAISWYHAEIFSLYWSQAGQNYPLYSASVTITHYQLCKLFTWLYLAKFAESLSFMVDHV